jgi:NADH-quinone oxidoreductase subunit G
MSTMNTSNPSNSLLPPIHLTINGIPVVVPKGTTVYQAARKAGIEIPIFCYQDRMPPFGACRACLVEVDKMDKLQTSCTLEATENMVVHTESQRAAEGQKETLELLLINHPLDCPICDKGGECPLQNQTMEFGPEKSRFYEEKRRFKKGLRIGPVLTLDRERCVMCARCTRFGDLVAGDHALEIIDRGYKSEIGSSKGDIAESKFIGNTIMLCPVGALTSSVYRFKARPWDNESVQSTCTLCPVGCSMIWDSRDGEVMRTRSCENHEVNDIWLCDKGWFGYEFTSSPDRLKTPLIRREGKLVEATWEEALSLLAKKIAEAKPKGRLAAFGGNPLTVEENYLFQKLMREGAGVNHLDHRIGTPIINIEGEGLSAGMESSIGECENLSYALLCGVDLPEEFPVIWLRLKQAINKGAEIVFAGNYRSEMAPYFKKTLLHSPKESLRIIKEQLNEWKDRISDPSRKGAVFIGQQILASPYRLEVLAEILKLKQSAPHLAIHIMEAKDNSMGARFAGMHPYLGPMGKLVGDPGLNALEVLEESAKNGWDLLYVAGANPALKFSSTLWKGAISQLKFLVVQDMFLTETAQDADLVLPTLCYAEKEGHFINIEGRIQKIAPGKEIPNQIYSDGEIFSRIANKLSVPLLVDEKFQAALSQSKIERIRPIALKGNNTPSADPLKGLQTCFTTSLFDAGVRMQHNPHLLQLVKKPLVKIHPIEGEKRGIADHSLIQLKVQGISIQTEIEWSDKVSEGTILLPKGFSGLSIQNLALNWMNGAVIEICPL